MTLLHRLSYEFIQRCEGIATDRRGLLGLRAFDQLSADRVARELGAILFTPEQLSSIDPGHLHTLNANDVWSAGVVCQDPLLILYNPRHAATRRESDLMHEMAHVLLRHQMVGFDGETGLPLRRQSDEDEATYLGSCLQIPRRGLLWATQKKMTLQEIAGHFKASEALVGFRLNATGIRLRAGRTTVLNL